MAMNGISARIIKVFLIVFLIIPVQLFSQTDQNKIENAKRYVTAAKSGDATLNTLKAVDELNEALVMDVSNPVTHYLLAYCYWNLSRRYERYDGELGDRVYDNTLLVKSCFYFILVNYLTLDESQASEASDMCSKIEAIYKFQTNGSDFTGDRAIIDRYFADGAVNDNEKMARLCYSLGLKADEEKDKYRAAAYHSFVTLLKPSSEIMVNSQNRSKLLGVLLYDENRRREDSLARSLQEHIPTWNNSFLANIYISYIFQTPLVDNSSNLHGVQISSLWNNSVAPYLSIATNSSSVLLNQSVKKYSDLISAPVEQGKISSLYCSVGITKKIYRPLFFTLGVGAGVTSQTSKYKINSTLPGLRDELWLNDNYSWSFSPEFGLTIADPFPFHITANIKYQFPFKKDIGLSYKNLVYTLGVGLTLPQPSKRFYLMYNTEYPNSKRLESGNMKNLSGITIGSHNGVYFSLRANKLYLSSADKYSNVSGKGSLLFTTGYEQKLFYPLHIYAGLGVVFQKWLAVTGSGSSDNKLNKKMDICSDLGLSLNLSYLKFRLGISLPKFKYDESYLSLGVGIGL